MTTQDADDQDTESAAADEQESEVDEEVATDESEGAAPESVSAFLSNLAEAPEGDVDELLADIISEGNATAGDGDADDGAEADSSARVETSPEPSEITVDEETVEELESMPSEQLARTLGILRAEIDRLNDELDEERARADDLESRLARKQADFQNYKKRQKKRVEEEKERATEDFVTRLLDVRDNLERALEQDEGADIRGGLESTLDQFDQQLERENVKRIEPEIGGETDPRRHEVLATIASEQSEDTIAQIHRPGYVMGEKVLRPAQVAVSDGSLTDEE